MLQEELAIWMKEQEYDLKSVDAAQKQQQESMKKITALEQECQRLRTMVQKRLPGPAALAKMEDEVKRRSTSSAGNGARRPRTVAPQAVIGREGDRYPVSVEACRQVMQAISSSALQMQLEELSDRVSQSRIRRIIGFGSDLQFLLGPLETEKLEMVVVPRPSIDPSQYVPDVHATEMVVSGTVHRDIISDDGLPDKYPRWIQVVLKMIISKL
ncbi:hypothetical protein PR202_gb15106 [Eleusine coracana subsp. coracana]|uniref:Uncharacterized protein n=1 Tax=Eleusine coracana subsp. coracana TaxID=191504 RepID=A0AAV5EWX4_ELECO|nr:hypothetical protein PR202_gb15106 [Eleusine coracana subsp. coracana]